jgi:hypothetical protein
MNNRGPAEAEGLYDGGDPQTPARGLSPWNRPEDAPAAARDSGVVSISRAQRPSWESVGEFLRDGSHREQIASCALRDPAFAEVVRWMVNEAAEADDSA